jgi:Ribbon-helix-helix protein, copG family
MNIYERGTKEYYKVKYSRSKELWCYQTIRLDHEDAEALREMARRKRTTVAELIRTFITWGLENDYGGADAD